MDSGAGLDRNSTALGIAVEHCEWAKRQRIHAIEVLRGFELNYSPPVTWDEVVYRLAALWLDMHA